MLLTRLSMLLSRHQRILTEPHKHIAQQLQLHLHRTAANAAAATAVTRTFSRGPNAAQRGQPETPAAAPAAAHSYPSETSKSAAGMLPALPSMDPAADSLQPLTIEETLQAVAMPPTGQNLGPRVEHVHVAAAGLLSEAIASALQLPQSFVLELIRFGAVHYCPVMPQPSPKAAPRMSSSHLQRMQDLRAAGIARHGKSPKLQVPRRMTADCQVEEGGYIRVHVHPKRFPAAYSVDWRQRVVADGSEYVVVDKPAGVQVPPTVDNMLESVVFLTATALGLAPDALLTTHRLDVGTSGIVVLAKTQGFAAWFNTLLKNKPDAIVKTYRCLTAAPPPLGPMVHWALVKERQAGEPAHTRMLLECAVPDADSSGNGNQGGAVAAAAAPVEGAARCELIVEQVAQVSLTGSAAREWGPQAYESTLQLVTGRTHQIRAQMAAVGCPLLGDQLYTALAALWQQEQLQRWQQLQQQQQQLGKQVQPTQESKSTQKLEQEQAQQQLADPQLAATSIQQQQQQQQQGSQQLLVQVHARLLGHERQQCGGGQAAPHQHQQQHRHAGAHWSKIYQEDPSRPIGLQAARLRVRNVAGRMNIEAVEASDSSSTEAQHSQELADAGQTASASEEPEWVEFAAGMPWWRS